MCAPKKRPGLRPGSLLDMTQPPAQLFPFMSLNFLFFSFFTARHIFLARLGTKFKNQISKERAA
jgi:hypothetical protein